MDGDDRTPVAIWCGMGAVIAVLVTGAAIVWFFGTRLMGAAGGS